MRLLIFRFSAMGDVALLAPVLSALARKYPNLSLTLVTRKAFQPFFYNIPDVEVIGVNLENYRGLPGLYRLFRELQVLGPYDYGIDVHGSTRSRVLKFLFSFTGLKFARIVKGRREKRKQVRRKNKELYPLPHVVDRYMHVFERAGFSAKPGTGPWIHPDTKSRSLASEFLSKNGIQKKEKYWIGIAPFAGRMPKTWPFEHIHELVSLLTRNLDCMIFLFGGGQKEVEKLQQIRGSFPDNTTLVAGQLTIPGEMALILRLDVMLAMDSFNMHMAALLGTRVLSIWGSTHPHSGFGPYGQGEEAIIQVSPEELPCRPCSIFGNKGCFRGDMACMNWITARHVYERISERLEISNISKMKKETGEDTTGTKP